MDETLNAKPEYTTGIAQKVAMGLLPLAPITALLVGGPLKTVLIASLVFSAMAYLSGRFESGARANVLAVALVGHCIAFTAAFAGHRWQIDSHMLYFAILAIVATMGSIPALLVAVAVTAVHHLAFGMMLPSLVFPSTVGFLDTVLRVVLHAAIVIFESAVLLLSMMRSAKADAEIRESRVELTKTLERAEAAQVEAEQARERALAVAERTRKEGQRAAVAVEEISAAADAASDNAANARNIVANTKTEAERSGDVILKTQAAMEQIKKSSAEIETIVNVIDEIARQTDLLALNAAVESARAGEAGRGFAVVANEVRELAQRSANASKQIRGLVSASSDTVTEGVNLVTETGEVLSKIAKTVAELNDMMADIAAGAAEQSSGLSQVTVAITKIDQIADDDAMPDDDGPDDEESLFKAFDEVAGRAA